MSVASLTIDADMKIFAYRGAEVVFEAEVVPMLWWMTLSIGSCMNLYVLGKRLLNMGKDPYLRKLTYCATVFVVACAVRSIWPRVDVERICFWDSRLSVTFVGRMLATVAEICFAAQFALTIGMLAESLCYHRTKRVSDIIFWAICIAQCCCWMGVTTQRQIWHGLEESIWACTFTCVAVCFAILYPATRRSYARHRAAQATSGCAIDICSNIGASGDEGYAARYLFFGFPISVAYVLFMLLVDVPMYVSRYRLDEARGASYMWFSEGVRDSMACGRVSKSMVDWAPEMPWMIGYFIGATAVSLWLTWGPNIAAKTE